MRLFLKKNIYLLLTLVAAMVAIDAYAVVRITGKITQEDNEPLEFVTIKVKGLNTGAISGLDGTYSLSVPDADTIRLVFTSFGYQEATRRLIGARDSAVVNVKMAPSVTALQTIEVTEYRRQTTQMQDLHMDSYRIAPDISGNGIESMITTMAGVASSNEMSSQYSVRGGTYDENSVYINGIEVYRPQLVSSGQQEGLSIINPDMVESVSFSTGGFPVQYADKMSSALDITYRDPQAFEGAAGVSLMGANLALGAATRRFSMLHGIRYKRNASLLSSMDSKGEYDPRFFDYQTQTSYRFSDKFKVSLLGNVAINDYKFVPATRQTSFGTSTDAKSFTVYFDGQEKDRFETFFGALSLNYKANKSTDFTLLTSAYLTNELVAYDISGEYWLDQAGTSGSGSNGAAVGGELGVGKYLEHARNRLKASVFSVALRGNTGINHHSISYGVQLNREKFMDRSREWELHDSAGYSLPVDTTLLKVIYNQFSHHDLESSRYSGYLMDTYRLSTGAGYFNINGGVRVSYWDFNKELLISPRANVGFVPDAHPGWAFRFATGLYYQSPFYKEYRKPGQDEFGNTIIELNDKIKSQRSLQFILGTDYSFRAFNRPFKLSGEVYYKLLSDIIPYEVDNLKVVYSGENSAKGYAAGIDMKVFGQFVPGSDSWISLSLMRTRETLNGVSVPRPTDRRYNLAIYFTDFFPKWPRLKFSLRAILSDGLPVTAPRSTRDIAYFRTPPYRRVDIGFAYGLVTSDDKGHCIARHLKNVWLGFDVFNILDISNVSGYYWVTDVNGIQYAVPNYLTRRQLNVRLSVEF